MAGIRRPPLSQQQELLHLLRRRLAADAIPLSGRGFLRRRLRGPQGKGPRCQEKIQGPPISDRVYKQLLR